MNTFQKFNSRESFIKNHLGLAYKIACCYSFPTLRDDLKQVAVIGLIKAVDKFQPELGYQFSSFAKPWIKGEIQHYLRDRLIGIKIPRELQGQVLVQSLDAHNERLTRKGQTLSLLDTLPDARQLEKDAFYVDDRLTTLLASISQEQRDTITLVYIEGLTQMEAAKRLKVNESAISRRIARGMAKMKNIAYTLGS